MHNSGVNEGYSDDLDQKKEIRNSAETSNETDHSPKEQELTIQSALSVTKRGL